MRDEYLSVQRQRGQPHPGLIGPAFPDGLEYLFHISEWADENGRERTGIGGWFGELSACRSSNGFGANPISYGEIKAWAELTGREPGRLEVQALRRLDAAYLTIMGRQEEKSG